MNQSDLENVQMGSLHDSPAVRLRLQMPACGHSSLGGLAHPLHREMAIATNRLSVTQFICLEK